jgi:hypothetical protein
VWSTVTDQAPGKAPDAMPPKRPYVDVAAYSSPLTESADVVAAIAAAGLMNRAAAATIGTIHPRHRMTYPPYDPAREQNSEGSSVVQAFSLARSQETALPVAYRAGRARPAGRHAPPDRRMRSLCPPLAR